MKKELIILALLPVLFACNNKFHEMADLASISTKKIILFTLSPTMM